MKRYSYYFNIMDISICVKIPFKINIGNESKNFIYNENKQDITINFIQIEERLNIKGQLIFQKDNINIYESEKKFIYELCPTPNKKGYAWIIKNNKYSYELYYLKGKEYYFEYSRNILNSIRIEEIINDNQGFILHSSFVKWKDKAILFSAPSGTGKSTQADLWSKYEGAKIINGDKTGIRELGEQWTAYGLPFAGTSNIFINDKVPISCIIVLRQGKENKIRKLSKKEAFVKIYSETIIKTWDKVYQNDIINTILNLLTDIPVYLYECLPNEEAVYFLKSKLEGDIK